MPRIFISYRRAESITITGRIHDRLETAFGAANIFKDVDDIPLGVDFRTVIEREIHACDVLLVIIGPQWLTVTSEDGNRRLEDPNDFVRLEVEAALQNSNITAIPVLVHNAVIPSEGNLPDSLRPLAFLNAAILRDDPDFNRDLSRLIQYIKLRFTEDEKPVPTPPETRVETTVPAIQPAISTKSDSKTHGRVSLKTILRTLLILVILYLLITGVIAGVEHALTGRYSTVIIKIEETLFGQGGGASRYLQIGDVAPVNIFAPTSFIYFSSVLTEMRRQAAAASVAQIYDPPDPNIARQQLQLARQTLDFIDNIRHDSFASIEEKRSDMRQISASTLDALDEVVIDDILTISTEQWKAIDEETINILERMMRESIREADVSSVRTQLPTQVGIRFSQTETAIIVAIVQSLIQPNTFINLDATEAARQAAVEATSPETRSFVAGQVIVHAGQVMDAVDLEALKEAGLIGVPLEVLIQEILMRGLVATPVTLIVLWLISPRLRAFLKFLFSWRFNVRRIS